jgi:glycerol kinase
MTHTERAESTAGISRQTRLVLAIDQGTSATKAVAVDEEGAIRRRASVPLAQRHPQPGWAEQDPLEIWRSAQQAVRELLADIEPSRVVAVGLSTQRESTVVWDRATGEPLGPVLGWQDTRAANLCAQLRAAGHAERVRSITGLPLDAMFSAGKASVLLDQHDPDRSRSRNGELCFGTVDSWLLWQLGGQHLIESGNAARTQLLDITSRKWDSTFLSRPCRQLCPQSDHSRTVTILSRCRRVFPSPESSAIPMAPCLPTPAGGRAKSRSPTAQDHR